jgi:hypothetical protein
MENQASSMNMNKAEYAIVAFLIWLGGIRESFLI